MQCPQCQEENREGRRFCAKCGAPLAITCAECGFANEPDDAFCGGCGKAVTAPSPTDSARKREVPDAERRQLSVMFCDLVGSTALAEQLDPEELRDLLAQYQQTCADVISRYEGHIARYVGDGLLVYFGYPYAHEDDPQRAVRAGLDIVDALRDLDATITHPSTDLAVRIGITTGLVVAGDIGSGERVEEKAIVGETPNIAARLQALAEPNAVVIGANTQRLVEGLFHHDELGPQQLKGISQPVLAYRVREESGVPSRFEAAASRGLTPLVAREEEIGLLLKRWKQAKEGEEQVVLLSGEAGIGKSRIVRAYRDRLEAEPHNRVLYYGSPYHQNSALHPVIDQLERGLRFEKNDSVPRKLEKLDAVLSDFGLPVAEHAPLLASLLSVSVDGRYPPVELGPEQHKKKTLETIVAMIQAMSSQRPVLMVVEDAHWVDPSTLELISLLIEQLRSAPFCLLITCRPDFESPWRTHTNITSLTLNRLSRKDSTSVIAKVARGKALPDEVREQILVRTDGVPLFIEELTKTLLESGLLIDRGDRYALSGPLPSLAIPASLQDSLMARLDRLGAVKEVAQLAATVGRTFSHELMAAVSPLEEEELENALTQLVRAELVYRRGLPPAVTYEFKHALVQDTAYQSLLKSTRQHNHQGIARVLEERFPEIRETQPETVARHCTEAGLADKAIGYWQLAGEKANDRGANSEAINHLSMGLEVLSTLPAGLERDRRELTLQTILGRVMTAAGGYGDTRVAVVYGRARQLCEQMGETLQLFPVLLGLAIYYTVRAEVQTARGLGERLLGLARQAQDPVLLVEAHYALGVNFFWLGDFAPAHEHLEQAIAHYDRDQHQTHLAVYGQDAGAVCLSRAAIALWYLGYPDQARARMHEAVEVARKLAHPFSLAYVYTWAAWLYSHRREMDESWEWTKTAINFSTKQGFPFWYTQGKVLQGWLLTERGESGQGVELMREGVAGVQKVGSEVVLSYALALLGLGCGKTGQTGEGLMLLDEALNKVKASNARWPEAELHRIKGELLLMQSANQQAESEACFGRAIEITRQQNAKSLELRAAMSLSRLWRDQGKRAKALDLLAPTYDWFTEGFDTADLKEAGALLDELR